MAAALECWSGRPSTDEDMVEQVLMKTHDRSDIYHSSAAAPPCSSSAPGSPSPASSSCSSSSSSSSKNFPYASVRGSTVVPPKKWQRIGRNFAGAISALKNSLNLDSLRDQMASNRVGGSGGSAAPTPPATSDRALWGGVVRSLSEMYPGCQLPEKLINDVRRHFDSLPNSYAHAGHDMKDVLIHMRLIEQAATDDSPALHIQELHDQPSADEEAGTLFRLTFASTAPISWPSISGSLDSSSAIFCKKIQLYEKKGLTLGILTLLVHQGGENLFRSRVDAAVRSAVRRPAAGNKSGGGSGSSGVKLHFGGLCGCQEQSSGVREDDSAADDEDEGGDFTGALPKPMPESSVVVFVSERQAIRSGGEELGRWLLNPDNLEIGDRMGPNSFKGWYRGKRVWIKRLKGSDRGSAYEIEVRKGLLELMSCGHRNILHFHGICLDAGQGLCMVSRMMEGGSVYDAVTRRGKKMAVRDVMRVAVDVAEGLRFMNDHGFAYRDLNAQRILLDKQGNACLGDMGAVTACRNAGEVTEYETEGYRWLAPEIIAGDPETVTETFMSNAYSFGMLIWEMITGEAAYSSFSPVQAAVGIAACNLRPEIPTDCPPILRSLMTKCWNSNPSKRPKFCDIVAVLSRHNTSR